MNHLVSIRYETKEWPVYIPFHEIPLFKILKLWGWSYT